MSEGGDDSDGSKKGGTLINFSIQDVLGVGPASKNIIDALRGAFGELLYPWIEARRGAGEQRTAKGWIALARKSGLSVEQFDVTRIEGRTDYRVHAEAVRQQESREAVALYVLAELPTLVDHKLIDEKTPGMEPEWLSRFWRLAQDISSDDLRSLWGHLLARQATGAGHVSARTLEALSLLDRWEIESLTRMAAFVLHAEGSRVNETGIVLNIGPTGEDRLGSLNRKMMDQVGVRELQHFVTIGLLSSAGWNPTFSALSSSERLTIGGAPFRLWINEHDRPNTGILGSQMSLTGREIIKLIRTTPPSDYIEILTELFRRAGLTLEPARG